VNLPLRFLSRIAGAADGAERQGCGAAEALLTLYLYCDKFFVVWAQKLHRKNKSNYILDGVDSEPIPKYRVFYHQTRAFALFPMIRTAPQPLAHRHDEEQSQRN
jgi:hypothetical protein